MIRYEIDPKSKDGTRLEYIEAETPITEGQLLDIINNQGHHWSVVKVKRKYTNDQDKMTLEIVGVITREVHGHFS